MSPSLAESSFAISTRRCPVALVVAGGILLRRHQAEGGDADRPALMDRSGETVGEVVGEAVEGEEALVPGARHLVEEALRIEPRSIGKHEIDVRNEVEDLGVAHVRHEQAARCGPRQRHRLADIGADAERPDALLHHDDGVFVAVEHAELRRLPGLLGDAQQEGAAFARQVELLLVDEAEEIEFSAKEYPAVIVGIFQRAGLDEEVHQLIGRRFRRIDPGGDLVRPRRLLGRSQEIEDLEGAIEAAHATAAAELSDRV